MNYRQNSAVNCAGCGCSLDTTTSGCGSCLRRRLREAVIATGLTWRKLRSYSAIVFFSAAVANLFLITGKICAHVWWPHTPTPPLMGVSVVGAPAPGQILMSNGTSMEPQWIGSIATSRRQLADKCVIAGCCELFGNSVVVMRRNTVETVHADGHVTVDCVR